MNICQSGIKTFLSSLADICSCLIINSLYFDQFLLKQDLILYSAQHKCDLDRFFIKTDIRLW